MTATKYKPRFTVRKQSSGYTHSVSYFVYDTVRKGRVSVHANRFADTVQNEADCLNVYELMAPAEEDGRPFEVRRDEAASKYREYTGRTPAFYEAA